MLLFSCEARETALKTIDTAKPLSNRFTIKSDLNKDISSDQIINKISRDAGLEKNQKLSDLTLCYQFGKADDGAVHNTGGTDAKHYFA